VGVRPAPRRRRSARLCSERAAVDTIWNAGNWRELVAEYADEQLDLADRLTGEGETHPAGGPTTPST
jgi:hypothetical protein